MKYIGILTVSIAETILNGFTFAALWGWFVAETFAVKFLTIPQALGLALIARFLVSHLVKVDDNKLSIGWQIFTSFMINIMFLALGFVYHLFVQMPK